MSIQWVPDMDEALALAKENIASLSASRGDPDQYDNLSLAFVALHEQHADLLAALKAEVSQCKCQGTGTIHFEWRRVGGTEGVPDSRECGRRMCAGSRAAIKKAEGRE